MGQGEDGGCHARTGTKRPGKFYVGLQHLVPNMAQVATCLGMGQAAVETGLQLQPMCVCVGCVYFIFVAGIPTEKFQPLLVDRHSCVKMYCS